MDALQMLIDEVALEGLDGITLSSLWIRLEDRSPKFPLKLDLATKGFIWKSLVCDADIEFYELPRERAQLVLFDRFAEIDPETGIQEIRRATQSPDRHEDSYPVKIIQDNKDGIQGSCQFFVERKNITSKVRTLDLRPRCSLEDAIHKWGEKLVMVASQKVRFRTLIGPEGDPDLKLSDHSYCILERLGRARWQGELQRDLHGRIFKTDAGKMHYLRKPLDKNGLITMQAHVIRTLRGAQQYSILILLKRFHVDRRSKYDILMEKVSNILAASPRNIGVMLKLRDQLGVCERTFKRVYQYMMAAKLAQVVSVPLRELTPDAGPCKTKKGTDILVRCLKLLKEYGKKDEDDEDENDEDDNYKLPNSGGPIRERDTLMQAYEIIISSGTKGISQAALRGHMNVGKLEGRMICRLLERNEMVKGFMEDEGRQRTTKYISKIFVEQSDLNRQFVKEKERSDQLRTGKAADASVVGTGKAADASVVGTGKAADASVVGAALSLPAEDTASTQEEPEMPEQQQPPLKGRQSKKTARSSKKPVKDKALKPTQLKQTKLDFHIKQPTPIITSTPTRMRGSGTKQAVQNPDQSDTSLDTTCNPSANSSNIICSGSADNEASVTIVEDVVSQEDRRPIKTPSSSRIQKPHQTYRLLKRKNLIIETVRSIKLIDNLYSLQKMIVEDEKQDGVSTKCCKKSILRLLRSLAREGMLKLFCTTVIQDGVSKKVEFVVHPSVTPDDPLVKSAIEQIRFRISSSCSAHRLKVPEDGVAGSNEKQQGDGTKAKEKGASSLKTPLSRTSGKVAEKEPSSFRPTIVPGLGRSMGFQPKLPRLRDVHLFLWYLIYGHPMRRVPAWSSGTENEAVEQEQSQSAHLSSESEPSNQTKDRGPTPDHHESGKGVDEGQAVSETDSDQMKVYVDELSWRRYIPPTPLHREFSHGWALTSDVLLSLPLSLFVQIIQVNYRVDGLDAFLNDPVKQYYLIRFLPGKMKKQLLYKRKYVFSFHECMQRLCYMGLLQFGPVEKFQDRDQVFLYLKTKATIVDTTTCEPHYNLVLPTRPFEHRRYTFDKLQDVENYWFDLQCVCLNTPLGVVRCPRGKGQANSRKQDDTERGEQVRPAEKYARLAYMLKGSPEVTDDGVIPGDGKGAGGLDSDFYSHLKRNWIWTSYLLARPRKSQGTNNPTLRLNSLLSKHLLPLSLPGANKKKTSMEPLAVLGEEAEITVEPSERNLRIVGGKKQKRKRPKKESVKAAKKKKKAGNPPKKRSYPAFHDEADLSALKRMTRQRVAWTVQEDSLLMLCRVASHFLNRKIKKPFVPWHVVRDLLHAQYEESLDKTSLSVGRRARYILKNPQTFLNFKICLAEVYQDKPLIEEFQNRRENYEDPEVCASEFKEFVSALRQKFSAAAGECSFEIPDSKVELFKRFKVYAIGDDMEQNMKDCLTSTEDIHSLVLNNLIQSTLVLSDLQMRSCRSFQTFHIYSRYKEEVLYRTFLKCQKQGLVNRRRIHKIFGPKKCRALPFLPMSYQLSQTYYRNFTWRIPNTICAESYEFLEALRSRGKEDRPNKFTFQKLEMSKREPVPESDMVLFPLDAPGGACVTSLSLMVMGLLSVELSIPDQIVVVDSALVDNEIMKSSARDIEEDEEDDEIEDAEGKKKIEVKAHQASHTNYLLMRGFAVPGIVSLRNLNTNDNVVVNSCTLRVKLRSTPAHALFSAGRDGSIIDTNVHWETCLPKRFTYLSKRRGDSGCSEAFGDRCVGQYGYSAEDLRAVLDILSAVDAARSFGCDRLELSRAFPALEEARDGRTRTFYQYLQDLVNLEEVLEVGGQSVRWVAVKHAGPWLVHTQDPSSEKTAPRKRSRPQEGEERQGPPRKKPALETEAEQTSEARGNEGELALSHAPEGMDVSEQSAGPSADAGAGAPEEEGAEGEGQAQEGGEGPAGSPVPLSPAGNAPAESSESADAAQTQNKDGGDSLIESTSDSVSYISRPWRVVDGSLNRPVCKGMLESLLFHVMSRPGLPESALMDHYRGVLQPVVVLDLLQGLEEMGCVQKKFMTGQPRASLFSPLRVSEVKEGLVNVRDNSTTFYEPTLDCCLRLSKVFPHEANWNKWVPFIHS